MLLQLTDKQITARNKKEGIITVASLLAVGGALYFFTSGQNKKIGSILATVALVGLSYSTYSIYKTNTSTIV